MKKPLFQYRLVLAVIFSFGASATAQWLAIDSGLTGTGVDNCFAVNGNNIFVGTWGGVYLSTNNGTTWVPAQNGASHMWTLAFAMGGGSMFAATMTAGVFLTTNSGTSWNAVNNGLPLQGGNPVHSLAVSGSSVFAGIGDSGVYRSNNNGSSWTAAKSGIPGSRTVQCFATGGGNIFAGTDSGVYLSSDDGASWTAVNNGLNSLFTDVYALALSGSNLFAGACLSTNNGTSWTPDTNGIWPHRVSSLTVNGSTLLAGTNNGVYASTIGGSAWVAVNDGLPANTYVYAVAVSGSSVFIGTQSNGLFRRSLADFLPPPTPSLSSPANGSTGVSVTPTLSWGTVAGTTSYSLQVSTDSSGFSSLGVKQGGLTSTSYGVAVGLTNNTKYYWRVNALSPAGVPSTWSSVWSFTTIVSVPSVPSLLSPGNSATSIATNPTLRWNKVAGAASYRIQASATPSFSSTTRDSSNIIDTTLALSGLANNAVYYWHVNATNAGGTSAWSSAWSFSTIVTLPAAVTLVLPIDVFTSTVDSVSLVWNKGVASVTKYWCEVASDSGYTNIFSRDSTLADTAKLVKSLSNNQSYWWRVKGFNAAGWGPFSVKRKFTISKPTTAVLPSAFGIKSFSCSNTARKINYALPKPCSVTIKRYDLQGRTAYFFVNKMQQPGYYSVSIGATSLSGKVYIQEFQAGDFIKIEQLTVVR